MRVARHRRPIYRPSAGQGPAASRRPSGHAVRSYPILAGRWVGYGKNHASAVSHQTADEPSPEQEPVYGRVPAVSAGQIGIAVTEHLPRHGGHRSTGRSCHEPEELQSDQPQFANRAGGRGSIRPEPFGVGRQRRRIVGQTARRKAALRLRRVYGIHRRHHGIHRNRRWNNG